MFFYSGENGTWFFFVDEPLGPSSTFQVNGTEYQFVPSCPADQLAPGQYTVPPTSRFEGKHEEICFHPLAATLNPNLDQHTYTFQSGKSGVKKKWPERVPRDDIPDGLRLDLFQEPKIRDFVQAFWRNHDSEIIDLNKPGHTVICRAIIKGGAGSLSYSINNNGVRHATTGITGPQVLEGMHALSVGAREIENPAYPPIIYCHHWGQIGAVVPGAAYVSFIREPIRRIVSCYCWDRDRGAQQHDIEAFIDELADNGFCNWQMDWLARLTVPLPHSLTDHATLPYFLDQTPGGARMSKLLVDMANANLNNHFFIGITECFEESLVLLSLLTKNRFVGRWPWTHRSSASDGWELGTRVRRRLEAYAEPEIALYERVRKQFEDRFADELAFIRKHIGSTRLS